VPAPGIIGAVKRLLVALVLAALLAGCVPPGGPPGRPRPAHSAAQPSGSAAGGCPEEGARIELTDVNAAMGARAMGLYLVNCGDRPYQVEGFPVVRALDEEKAVLDVEVVPGAAEVIGAIPWDRPPTTVLLQPGERAGSVIVWRNTYDDIRRPPVAVPHLRIAPGTGRPAQVLTPAGPLDLGSTGRLGVSAWQPAGPPP
jgi:uncharacterized protein DUF4232